MILLPAVLAGLIAGWIRSKKNKQPYIPGHLKLWWLVFIAFIPQWVAFSLPFTSTKLPDNWAAVVLVGSLVVLLIFTWFNRKQPGFWLLGLGLIFNLIVIGLNGGFMPISPEAVYRLVPNAPQGSWHIGERLGTGKDIVLLTLFTNLWFLSDRFLLPTWLNYPVAFSVGDVLIAAGAFWILWAMGGPQKVID
jgi:hypothetical protein